MRTQQQGWARKSQEPELHQKPFSTAFTGTFVGCWITSRVGRSWTILWYGMIVLKGRVPKMVEEQAGKNRERQTDRQTERHTHFHPLVYLHSQQQLKTGQAKDRNQEPNLGLPCNRGPSTGANVCSLWMHKNRKLDLKGSRMGSSQHSHMGCGYSKRRLNLLYNNATQDSFLFRLSFSNL